MLPSFNNNPRILFLIDGIGAFITAFMIGIILPLIDNRIGIPKEQLYNLSRIATLYSMISLSLYVSGYFSVTALKAIAIANFGYCVFTMTYLIFFYETLSLHSLIYFLSEIVIIVLLGVIELQTARRCH